MEIQNLTYEDKIQLQFKTKPSINYILFSIIWLLSFSTIFIVFTFDSENIKYVLWLIIGIVFIYIYYFKFKTWKYRADLERGEKFIEVYSVQDKYSEKKGVHPYSGANPDLHFKYYIVFEKLIAEVSSDTFNESKIGDKVKVHIAPLSRLVITVEKPDFQKRF
jgi:hypothetical protein